MGVCLICLAWATLRPRDTFGRVLNIFGMGRPMKAISIHHPHILYIEGATAQGQKISAPRIPATDHQFLFFACECLRTPRSIIFHEAADAAVAAAAAAAASAAAAAAAAAAVAVAAGVAVVASAAAAVAAAAAAAAATHRYSPYPCRYVHAFSVSSLLHPLLDVFASAVA